MNGWRLLCAVAFYIHQNNYYGWHRQPQSDSELIVDGITCLLFALAFTWRAK